MDRTINGKLVKLTLFVQCREQYLTSEGKTWSCGTTVVLMFAFGVNVTLDGSIADTTINMICNPTY